MYSTTFRAALKVICISYHMYIHMHDIYTWSIELSNQISQTYKLVFKVVENVSLISNQVEKPHAIVKYPNVTGKRHSGSAAHIIQTKSNHRDSKLLAAEQARLQRVAVAKGSTYQSDARKYFGFKSSVLQPKPRLFQQTTARSRVRLNQHTAPLY